MAKQTNAAANPSAPLNSPSHSNHPMTQLEQRKNHKVRKVRSEVKYVDPPAKNSIRIKNKETKSDHESLNETDVSLSKVLTKIISDALSSYDVGSIMRVEFSCSKL